MTNQKTASLMGPTVHLNGTSRASLVEALETALDALRRAATALEATAPDGRDYYVQGSHALGRAQEEHRSRVERIGSVRTELAQIWEAIDL